MRIGDVRDRFDARHGAKSEFRDVLCRPPTCGVATTRRADDGATDRQNGVSLSSARCVGECRVREVVADHLLQPSLVHDDDVVHALTSDRPDNALDVSILPGRARRYWNLWMLTSAMGFLCLRKPYRDHAGDMALRAVGRRGEAAVPSGRLWDGR